MSDELFVFVGSAGVAVIAGFIVRVLALGNDESLNLALLDFTKDLFAAAAAVFPTTLIIQREEEGIQFTAAEFAGTLMLVAAIAIWAKGDTRYFSYWRGGKKRVKNADGTLGGAVQAGSGKMRKAMAFLVGNALGFMVLYFSTVLSQQVAAP
jgi:hypothetical protein